MTTIYEIRGITDEVTTCDCCGKKSLKDTVALEVMEGNNAGDIRFFGSHCAARAMGQPKGKAEQIVLTAKRRARMEPVVQFAIAALRYARNYRTAVSATIEFAAGRKSEVSVFGGNVARVIQLSLNGVVVTIHAPQLEIEGEEPVKLTGEVINVSLNSRAGLLA